MPRHQWTKDDIRVVFETCKENADKKEDFWLQFKYRK